MQKSCPDLFAVVQPVIQNGSYWFHSENLILAALADKRKEIREKAVNRILAIRNDEVVKEKVKKTQLAFKQKKKCSFKKQRVFIKPDLKYDSQDYVDIIDWENEALYEPPFTMSKQDAELESFISEPLVWSLSSHSVLTERTIRDVDSLSSLTTSEEKRDRMIRVLHKERKEKIK